MIHLFFHSMGGLKKCFKYQLTYLTGFNTVLNSSQNFKTNVSNITCCKHI